MLGNKKRKFVEDFKEAKKMFPDLYHLPTEFNFFQVKGDITIYDKNDHIRGFFSIEIMFTQNYPKGFADLYEIRNRIKAVPDWHKGEDNRCCICALPEEFIQRQRSNSILNFITEYTIPFFANHLHKEEYGCYPNGEYKHGMDGTIQWYYEAFPNYSPERIIAILKLIADERQLPKHFQPCLCGSGVKFKKCHQKVCRKISSIPELILRKHISYIEQATQMKNTN